MSYPKWVPICHMFFWRFRCSRRKSPKHVLVVNFSGVDGKVEIDPRLMAVKTRHGRSVDAQDVLD